MKLNEVVIPSNDQMTDVQQTALLSIFIGSGTSPEAAAESLKGDAKKMAAGEYLTAKQFITLSQAGVAITQRGMNELISSGLVQQGQVTPKGRQLINVNQPKPQAPQQAPQTQQAPQQQPPAPQGGIT